MRKSISKDIISLSPKAGAIQWRVPSPVTERGVAISSVQEDGLFLTDGKKLFLLNIESGAVKWEMPAAGGAVRHIAPVDERIFIISRFIEGDTSRDTVTAFRRELGTAIWSCPLFETIQSSLLTGADCLYFSTRSKLYSLDILTGRVRFVRPIPAPLEGESNLPDILSEYDGKVILARETGVAAFAQDNGAVHFSERVIGGRSFTYHYSMNRYMEMIQVALGPGKAGRTFPQFHTIQDTGYLRLAQAHHDFIYSTTAQTLRTGTRPERMSAHRERASATDHKILAMEMQRQNEIFEAQMNLANAIGDALMEWGAFLSKEMFQKVLSNTVYRLIQSIFNHNSSLNLRAGVYIRPFYQEGFYLAVVDLKTGRRADILLSPTIDPLRYLSTRKIKLTPFAFDPAGVRLFVQGLGLQELGYETYEMMHNSCDMAVRRWIIPYPSILSYDIPAIFQSAEQPRRAIAQDNIISERERTMIIAALKGDEKMVKDMVEQGANIDAVDEDGHTALMHAVLALNPNIVEFLLKSGADIYIKDDDCWTAGEYWNLTHLWAGTGPAQKVGRLLGQKMNSK